MARIEVPAGVRLVRRKSGGREPAAPFGLKRFDPAASAVCVMLDGAADVAEVAGQIPEPATLAPGTFVVVLAESDGGGRDGGVLGRLFRSRPTVSRALRGSALLVRGYASIGGADDLVWGFAPA